jgi:hypothetical protein
MMNNETTKDDCDIVKELVRSIDVIIWNLNQMRGKIADLKIRSNSDSDLYLRVVYIINRLEPEVK